MKKRKYSENEVSNICLELAELIYISLDSFDRRYQKFENWQIDMWLENKIFKEKNNE